MVKCSDRLLVLAGLERQSPIVPNSMRAGKGWPSTVVRAGTLPIGVQVVAHPWREDVSLAVAGEIEKAHGPFPGIPHAVQWIIMIVPRYFPTRS